MKNQHKNLLDDPHQYIIQSFNIIGQEHAVASGYLVDITQISEGGIRFTSDLNFEVEDRLEIILQLPDKHCKHIWGRISYCEQLDTNKRDYCFSITNGFNFFITTFNK